MHHKYIPKIILSATLAVAGSIAGPVYADQATYTPSRVGCFDNGHCFIMVSPSVDSATSSCADRSQVRWLLSSPGGDAMYRTALAAIAAGRKLDINTYVGNTCVDANPQVWYLMLD